MATTTNYAWETPDDTDLVKDGAAAIRTLGSSVDTSVKALNPGTTAGDIDYYTSATAKARIAKGTAGQVLAMNSGATAPEWQTVSSGGMTLLSTNTVSGAGYTISSINQSYTDLLIVMDGITSSTSSPIYFMPNGVTDFSYSIRTTSDSATTTSPFRSRRSSPTSANNGVMCIYFNLYSATNISKPVRYWGGADTGSSETFMGYGYWGNDTALTSFKIEAVDNPAYTLGGTIRVYGVK
jgi:hypothetical protein